MGLNIWGGTSSFCSCLVPYQSDDRVGVIRPTACYVCHCPSYKALQQLLLPASTHSTASRIYSPTLSASDDVAMSVPEMQHDHGPGLKRWEGRASHPAHASDCLRTSRPRRSSEPTSVLLDWPTAKVDNSSVEAVHARLTSSNGDSYR